MEDESNEVRAVVAELAETLASRFEIVGRLGSGGMGLVVLARDPLLERNVAIKILAPHLVQVADYRAKFIREAQAAAAVSHPNIVAIHLVGELPRSHVPYFVMQHVNGVTLEGAFRKGETVAETDATRILGDVAFALAAAHERGIVHRDVKPTNVMIEQDTGRVIVLDFGISSLTDVPAGEGKPAGRYAGTPRYMSPEQAAGVDIVTPKSDSYSLGCVAYELMTHKPPFEGNSTLVLMAAHMDEPPPDIHALRPDLSPRFARLVNRCLQKDPAQRPSSDEIRRTLAPPQALLAWPPREALPMRDATYRGMVWLNVASVLLIVRIGPLLGAVAALVALGDLALAAARWRRLQRFGFSAWPLFDILGDHDGRTGELLLGQRRFAALSEGEQRDVGSARVMRTAARNLLLPTAALGVMAAGQMGSLIALAWVVVWIRAVRLESRLVGESLRVGAARRLAPSDARRLARWLDRYWGAWRGVDRNRTPSTGAMIQRVIVIAIIAATLLTCVYIGLRRLIAGA